MSLINQCTSYQDISHPPSPITKFNLTVCHPPLVAVRAQIQIHLVSATKQGPTTQRIFSEIQKPESIIPKAVMPRDGRNLTRCCPMHYLRSLTRLLSNALHPTS